jgi:hypothetical protein
MSSMGKALRPTFFILGIWDVRATPSAVFQQTPQHPGAINFFTVSGVAATRFLTTFTFFQNCYFSPAPLFYLKEAMLFASNLKALKC